MRDRLIELIKSAKAREQVDVLFGDIDDVIDMPSGDEYLANYLLANGVIVPPCKVGDTVLSFLEDNRLLECEVKQFYIDKKEIGMTYEPKAFRGRMYGVNIRAFGKTVFLTKEEAERALKEREKVLQTLRALRI